MKRKRLIINLGLVLLLSFVSMVPVHAPGEIDDADLVSLEECVSSFKNAYEEYGVGFKVIDSSNYTPITRETLESQLKSIEING